MCGLANNEKGSKLNHLLKEIIILYNIVWISCDIKTNKTVDIIAKMAANSGELMHIKLSVSDLINIITHNVIKRWLRRTHFPESNGFKGYWLSNKKQGTVS